MEMTKEIISKCVEAIKYFAKEGSNNYLIKRKMGDRHHFLDCLFEKHEDYYGNPSYTYRDGNVIGFTFDDDLLDLDVEKFKELEKEKEKLEEEIKNFEVLSKNYKQ